MGDLRVTPLNCRKGLLVMRSTLVSDYTTTVAALRATNQLEALRDFQTAFMQGQLRLVSSQADTLIHRICCDLLRKAITSSSDGEVFCKLSRYTPYREQQRALFLELTKGGYLERTLGTFLEEDGSYYDSYDGFVIDIRFGSAFCPAYA